MRREDMAKYAYENVPFYRDLPSGIKTSWEDYPVIDKEMISQRIDALFSPEYMMDFLGERLEHVMTSGSTGDCLKIFWQKEQNKKSLIPLWVKRKRFYGILPNDRRCYFFTTKVIDGEDLQIEKTEYGLGFNKMNLSEAKIISICREIREFNPKWMIVQPSMILLLMQIIQKHKLPIFPHLAYIELTGERIENTVKIRIAEFFGCKVASQYGCYETNSIAYECPYGKLHVMSENVFVETVDEDNLCITSLHNKVMPFIRYKIGDRGKLIHNPGCQCNSKEPVIELKMARENDWIYNSDGTVCHSDLFCHVIDKINLELQQAIVQYQIVQVDYKVFEVYFVIHDRDEETTIKELFLKNYERYRHKSEFSFFFVDSLYPSEKTGKLAWFVSKCKRGDRYEN